MATSKKKIFQCNKLLIQISVAVIVLIITGCDYWTPPLQEQMVEDGGAFKLWWKPDDSPSYEIQILYQHSDTTFVTSVAETINLRQLTRSVELNSLNKRGGHRGYSSGWDPRHAAWINVCPNMYPLNYSDSIRIFGYGFDIEGNAVSITLRNLHQFNGQLACWVDSSETELVGFADTSSPDSGKNRSYIAIADTSFPDTLFIAPPTDTERYRKRIPLCAATSYWLWIDLDPAGYDTNDHFAMLKVRYMSLVNGVEVQWGYQPKGGFRWFPDVYW